MSPGSRSAEMVFDAPLKLDPVAILLSARGPVFVVVWLLVAASLSVFLIALFRARHLGRAVAAERRFEDATKPARTSAELFAAARRHPEAPGARVALVLGDYAGGGMPLIAIARRAIVAEQERLGYLMSVLASIASVSPFIGLFGTAYGLLEVFLKIGQYESVTLLVVAPPIGEAIIATALGFLAATLATIAYNAFTVRIERCVAALHALSEGWAELAARAAPSTTFDERA